MQVAVYSFSTMKNWTETDQMDDICSHALLHQELNILEFDAEHFDWYINS